MFFDIDGTLMEDSSSHFVPESTVTALHKARQAGNLLFVNTGRPLINVDADVRKLGFDGYICGCGTYIEIGGREVFYRTNDPARCREIAALVRACDCAPLYERRDAFFFDPLTRDLPFIRMIRDTFRMQEKDIWRSVSDKDFSFDKFVIAYDGQSDLARFKEGIAPYFAFIDRGQGFAEMTPLPYSKQTGMEYVLYYYGMDQSQAYAIGDSLNDLPMFAGAGTSIAMGNGEMLIPYADYVTDDLWHDGIYNAMAHFGFF
ncbi:MAG: HAD hydrolase family protein [Oscillospiraceae bacterium]|nr:HAD hydrolase family protein [Oscillospiraceae bacterium]